ncbi:suppressor of fused domain protein [Bacillus zanthoxyli]
MKFLKKNELKRVRDYYYEYFGNPSEVFEYSWEEEGFNKVDLDRNFIKDNTFYIFEFPPYQDRPIWTYVTLGMSTKTMLNGSKGELIWLNKHQNPEIIELLAGLVNYPFFENTSYDYGHTISNADLVSNFLMNVILITPPVIEAEDSTALMEFFERKNIELFWLLPIHQSEKEYIIKKKDFSAIFDIWMEEGIDPAFLCDPNRPPTI